MFDLVDFTGRKIIVTGASSGIGRCSAITLSKLGAELVLVARREEKLRETLSQLEGEGHSYYSADLSDTNHIEPLIKDISSHLLGGGAYMVFYGLRV
ncbi:MAG: SDR family NAD(P)-dependent oxidoreductase [Synergistaceae bacterium]|nr:SDR family NAD(P)-dependent oxidoreductase [Synergistaceae bacterium]